MQLMVADAKKQAAEEFSATLNAELTKQGVPVRGRPAWFSRELKKRVKLRVSVTTCQKWLGGQQIPRTSHLKLIVKAFGLNYQVLMAGEWEPPPGADDPLLEEIHRIWGDIRSEADRQFVVEAARRAAGHTAAEPPAQPQLKTGTR